MPFTAAHPLAVLPLVRWRVLDPTCLVIGSMAPDFEYFARGEQLSTISHTLRGLWMWNLPVTLLLAALYHAVVKWPMLLVAPVAVARRAVASVGAPWRERWTLAAAAACAVSAVLGAASHLAWDTFTHADGWGPHHVRALAAPLHLPRIGTIVVHRVLQHASTAVGLTVLAVVIVRGLARRAPVELPALPRAVPRVLAGACVAGGIALTTLRLVARHVTDAGDLVVGALAGALAGTLIASALLQVRSRRLAAALG
jgi:hypothetical protein